ncbi:hypothetical protein LG3211_2772 [Lysobacter gummosus]|nr:hypothetical protein LG3211_2772 [Lysobacter gummosus]
MPRSLLWEGLQARCFRLGSPNCQAGCGHKLRVLSDLRQKHRA